MTINFKIFLAILTIPVMIGLCGCTNTMKVLEGSSHACGELYLNGPFTGSQGTVRVLKVPSDWTPEQVDLFCG